MPQSIKDFKNHFAPRWVILIYMASVVEAVGFSIYFEARLPDPEMASMQPQYVEMQGQPARVAQQPACSPCLLLAGYPQQAAIKR